MAHLVQKGSTEYLALGKKCLTAFALVAVASTGLIGCVGLGDSFMENSHNLTSSVVNKAGRGLGSIFTDKVCTSTSQQSATRNASGTVNSANSSGVRENCIEPTNQEKFDKVQLASQERLQIGQAKINAEIQKRQAEAQAEIQAKQMDINHNLSIKQECQNLFRQSIIGDKPMSSEHACFTAGYLSPQSSGVVMPAKKDVKAGQSQVQKQDSGSVGGWFKSRFDQ